MTSVAERPPEGLAESSPELEAPGSLEETFRLRDVMRNEYRLGRVPAKLAGKADRGDPLMEDWPGVKVTPENVMQATGDPRDWFHFYHRLDAYLEAWAEFYDARAKRRDFFAGFDWNQILILGELRLRQDHCGRQVCPPLLRPRTPRLLQRLAAARLAPGGGGDVHRAHINPAGCVVNSNSDTRCSRIAEHSGYHEC